MSANEHQHWPAIESRVRHMCQVAQDNGPVAAKMLIDAMMVKLKADFLAALEAARAFNPKLNTGRQREYAIAAVLHLEHMAELNQSPVHAETLAHNIYLLAQSLDRPLPEVTDELNRALDRHRSEWNAFKTSIGADSFMADWFAGDRP